VDDVLQRIQENRAAGIDKVIDNVDFRSARLENAISEAAALIAEARARGYRTPHKC
jgi:hypothetical protein